MTHDNDTGKPRIELVGLSVAVTHPPQRQQARRVAHLGAGHPLDGAPIISAYSRADAIDDGVLIECTNQAHAVGFVYPLCITSAVWGAFISPGLAEIDGENEAGELVDRRLRSLLIATRVRAATMANTHNDRVFVEHPTPDNPPRMQRFYCLCSGGDQLEPVLTVMLEGED